MRNFSIGYTAHNLESELIKVELLSLAENNIKLDFIIYHQKLIKRKLIELYNRIFRKSGNDDKKIVKYLKKTKAFNIRCLNSSKGHKVLNKYCGSVIICNSGLLSKQTIRSYPGIIFLNKHCSQLPKYRGVNNIEWALWDSSPVYASIIRIHHGIDEGDILYQGPLEIDYRKYNTLSGIRFHCFRQLCSHTGAVLSDFLNNRSDFIPQSGKGNPLSQYYSMHPILKDKLENRINSIEFNIIPN